MNDTIQYNTKVYLSTFVALEDGKPYIIQQGGTSSGKTFNILLALFQYAMQSEKPLWISIVAATFPNLKKGAIKDFDYILASLGYDGKKNKTDSRYTINNSTFEFFAVDSWEKAKHGKRDILFANECDSIDWTIINQLILRTYQTSIFDYNPSSEFWLHTDFIPNREESDYLFQISTYKDNPSLDQKTIKEIESLPPDLFRIYGEGKLGQISGLIFTNWDVCDRFPENAKNITYGLDFGFTNDPTAMVKIGLFDGCLYVQELIYETGLSTSEIAEILRDFNVSKQITIQADSSEPRLISELWEYGYYIKGVTKGADSVRAGIMKLQQLPIRITKDSTSLIREFKNYKWKEKDGRSLKVPIDRWNHGIDALRYAAIDLRINPVSDVIGWR